MAKPQIENEENMFMSTLSQMSSETIHARDKYNYVRATKCTPLKKDSLKKTSSNKSEAVPKS